MKAGAASIKVGDVIYVVPIMDLIQYIGYSVPGSRSQPSLQRMAVMLVDEDEDGFFYILRGFVYREGTPTYRIKRETLQEIFLGFLRP